MSWTLVWTERARKDLRGLGKQAADRVVRGVERFASSEHGDVKQLQGADPPAWRLRVGDYRVIFAYDRSTDEVQVQRVAPRGRAYRD